MRKMVVWVDAIVLMRRLQQRCLLPLRRRAHEHRVATLRRLAAEEQAKLDAATAAAAAVAGAAPAPGGEARGSSEATCASTLSSSKEGPSAVTTSAGALRASATQPGGLVVAHTGGCQPSEYDERGWLLLARLSLVRHLLHRWQGLVDAWLAELDSQVQTWCSGGGGTSGNSGTVLGSSVCREVACKRQHEGFAVGNSSHAACSCCGEGWCRTCLTHWIVALWCCRTILRSV